MGDQVAKGDELERKAEKKLNGWGLFGSKYEDASDLYDKAANSYKLAKSWDKAGSTYIKLANCHLKLESKHEAASAYIDAANCYKKTSPEDEWWMNFGIDDLEFQNLAIRILSQTCSSSGCERNWSVFERIHTKRRNRLEHKRLNDLAYTHYNLHLKERQSSRKSLTDPISLENIDLIDDWVVEAEDDDALLLDIDEIDDWMDVADAILDEGEGGAAAEAIRCLNQAVNFFMEIGRLNMAARYCKEIGELYELEQNFELSMEYFERAADLFQSEEVTTSANQCKQKVAQFAAQLDQYPKAIEIFELIARQSMNNNLLKYSVKGILLNAGLCQICKGDIVAITNSLERYQELDPTFSGTREYKFLADLASSIDEEDVAKFTDVVKEFDSMTRLTDLVEISSAVELPWLLNNYNSTTDDKGFLYIQDSWKTSLLLKAKNALKAKEVEEDDLT